MATALVEVSALDDLFGALSDPTRRALFERLVKQGPDTATRLAEHTTLTRQAVVKHLQALVEAGLASSERDGREVRYKATPDRWRPSSPGSPNPARTGTAGWPG